MKRLILFPLVVLLLTACLPAPTLAPTPLTPDTSRLTPSPTPAPPTETPAPTATITPTPETPGIQEQAKMDFEEFGYPTDGLTFTQNGNEIVATDVDGKVTGEKGRVVYTKTGDKEGLFYWRFAAREIDPDTLMPTKFPPERMNLISGEAEAQYIRPLYPQIDSMLSKMFNLDIRDIQKNTGVSFVLLDKQRNAWGIIFFMDELEGNYDLPTTTFFIYENREGAIVIVPAIDDFSSLETFNFDPDQ